MGISKSIEDLVSKHQTKNKKQTINKPALKKQQYNSNNNGLLKILYFKKSIDVMFLIHIERLFNKELDIANIEPIVSAYFFDINRLFGLKYIIPTDIIAICVNYNSQNIYPLMLKNEIINDNRLSIRTIQRDDNIIGIATKESRYHWREKLICNKLNGMIVIDLDHDVNIKWKAILCENNGNIFIRCNNLILDGAKIATTKQINAFDIQDIKQKQIKNNPNIFGNVILIVQNLLDISGSSIFTGFLYIECGQIKTSYTTRSYLISSREQSIIIVNGQRRSHISGCQFNNPMT